MLGPNTAEGWLELAAQLDPLGGGSGAGQVVFCRSLGNLGERASAALADDDACALTTEGVTMCPGKVACKSRLTRKVERDSGRGCLPRRRRPRLYTQPGKCYVRLLRRSDRTGSFN